MSRPQQYGRAIPLAELNHCNARPSSMSKAATSIFTASRPARAVLTQTCAISIWFSKSAATQGALWASYRASTDDGYFAIISLADGRIRINGWVTTYKVTSAAWATGWNHACVLVDLGAAAAANRVRLFMNGLPITAFTTDTGPATTDDDWLNLLGDIYVGDTTPAVGGGQQHDGLLVECAFLDDCGASIGPGYFGQRVNSYWVPRRPFIPSGRRGFHLTLEAGAGQDASENLASFTPTGVSAGPLQRIAAIYGA